MKEPTENERLVLLTSKHASEGGWSTRADATLVVNDLRDALAIHDRIFIKGMAHPSDVRLVGAVLLWCVIAGDPSAVAADDEPLGRGGCGRMGCHSERPRSGEERERAPVGGR